MNAYYVLRFKSKFEKQTSKLIKDYKDTLAGTPTCNALEMYVNAHICIKNAVKCNAFQNDIKCITMEST